MTLLFILVIGLLALLAGGSAMIGAGAHAMDGEPAEQAQPGSD